MFLAWAILRRWSARRLLNKPTLWYAKKGRNRATGVSPSRGERNRCVINNACVGRTPEEANNTNTRFASVDRPPKRRRITLEAQAKQVDIRLLIDTWYYSDSAKSRMSGPVAAEESDGLLLEQSISTRGGRTIAGGRCPESPPLTAFPTINIPRGESRF